MITLSKIESPLNGHIYITGSKSETNRLLILQKLFPAISILNKSNSDDSTTLINALNSDEELINIGHAGTAMRFLTAYFATKEGVQKVLTGSPRMQNRPIKILVEALQSLGANIQYLDKEGFPPLKIIGKKIVKDHVKIDGSVSSQYISALLLIAPTLPKGLILEFKGNITSIPYIKMTLELLKKIDVSYKWEENIIKIKPKAPCEKTSFTVESDWSSASYFYSIAALQPNSQIKLSSYKEDSLQGDASIASIYEKLGVETIFNKYSITLKSTKKTLPKKLDLNLANCPDIAQTITVTCFGLGISCFLSGLHTLKIKETDRLVALKTEIEKLGGKVTITDDSLLLEANSHINEHVEICTYDDHRMAMAFAPLATKVAIKIKDEKVVSKSYPDFWKDFSSIHM